jgi:hypothetical protein
MANFVFPSSDLDNPNALLNILGSFWANTYHARDQIKSYVRARGSVEMQYERDLLELIATVSRFTVPVYHRDNWYLLRMLESERNNVSTSLLLFDDPDVPDAVYDSSYQYDVPRDRPDSAFPVPSNLEQAPLAMNRITSPSLTLTEGIEYALVPERNAIVFKDNPFDNDLIPKQAIFENGVIVDREAVLWLFMADFDYDRIFRQFSYVVGLRLQSSEGFRDLMNTIFDGIVDGPQLYQVERAFEAMTGIMLCQSDGEVVELIDSDSQNTIVATDKNIYKYELGANIIVQPNEELYQGQEITDGLQVHEFNAGITPDELEAIAMGKGFLAVGFLGDIVFENKDITLEVTEANDHPTGYTYLKWGLGGFPLDVEAFFDQLHANGVQKDQTLAMLLDQRAPENQIGQPTAFNLPSMINPLEFLVENVLRNNAFVVKVKVSDQLPSGVGLHNVRHLRKIIQPHTAMIVIYELTAGSESVTVDLVSEAPAPFTATEPIIESIDGSSLVSECVTVRKVSETCH